jgi:dipeptidyl aminopeptidase/acylaminoacyl peptidase
MWPRIKIQEDTVRNVLAFLAFFLVVVPVDGQDRRPMTTDDALDMVRVGGALISPDGSWVLFSKSELDWDENQRNTTWWKVLSDGSEEPWPFIGEEGGSAFQFSPDGEWLSFTRIVDDKRQLFIMRTNGGEAVRLSDHETAIGSYQWTDDGTRIVFLASHRRTDEEDKEHKAGSDAIFVDEGPNGQTEGEWNDLWSLEVDTKRETRLTESENRIGSFSVAPDGNSIVFTARTENRRNQGNLSEIYLLDVESREVRQLTDNRSPEGRLTWAPDGRRIAYEAPSDGEWDLRLDKIWVMDIESGRTKIVSGAFDGNIRQFVWASDGSALLFSGLQGTNNNLYRLDLTSERVEKVTEHEGSLAPSSFSADRSMMAYVAEDWRTPPDVWVGRTNGGDSMKLTDANPWVSKDLALGQSRLMQWKSRDGREIEGILMLPEGASEDLPLLLHIHGGPAGVFTNTFNARAQVWSGLGYAQLFPNVRGSSGYTDEVLRGNMNDIGGGDYWDLMTGVDAVIDQGIADEDLLGLRGWSYGGILGGWTITQTERFKGASVGAMVSDWTSEYGPGFNHDVSLWYIGGTPWDNPEEWRYRSALTHVANVTTPTLILHGMNDRTDTEPQSMMFFQALRDQDKTTRYIRFPREPHGFREPRHQRTRDVEEIRWIQKYVRGIEWEPWARPSKDSPEVIS